MLIVADYVIPLAKCLFSLRILFIDHLKKTQEYFRVFDHVTFSDTFQNNRLRWLKCHVPFEMPVNCYSALNAEICRQNLRTQQKITCFLLLLESR